MAQLGVVAHACNPSTWETKAGGLRILDQLGLDKTLSQNK
jgi:hypothetical protein